MRTGLYLLLLLLPFTMACQPNYYVFALSRCSEKAPWGIHGLWPEWNSTSWPQFCNMSDPLDLKNIQPLIPLMKERWYSCEGNNTAFWEHEWLKHGTCTTLDQYGYFSVALYLYEVLAWKPLCNPWETNCLVPLEAFINPS